MIKTSHVNSIFSCSIRAERTSSSVSAPEIILCLHACTFCIRSSTVSWNPDRMCFYFCCAFWQKWADVVTGIVNVLTLTMKRLTWTALFCPIRWIRMIACSSTAGFHHGSYMNAKKKKLMWPFRLASWCKNKYLQVIGLTMHRSITIRNTLEAAVKLSPTPPALSDISST